MPRSRIGRRRPAQRQRVTRHLHDDRVDAAFTHRREQRVQLRRLRRRQGARHPMPRHPRLDRADQADRVPGRGETRFDQVRRRGLPRGAGDSDDLHVLGRVPVDGRRGLAEDLPRIGVHQHRQRRVRLPVRTASIATPASSVRTADAPAAMATPTNSAPCVWAPGSAANRSPRRTACARNSTPVTSPASAPGDPIHSSRAPIRAARSVRAVNGGFSGRRPPTAAASGVDGCGLGCTGSRSSRVASDRVSDGFLSELHAGHRAMIDMSDYRRRLPLHESACPAHARPWESSRRPPRQSAWSTNRRPGSGDIGTLSRCSSHDAMLWNSGAADWPPPPSIPRTGASSMMPMT